MCPVRNVTYVSGRSEVADPVVTGLVPSLSRPGANVTGFTHLEPSMYGKYVDFLKEIAPQITCVAISLNPATSTPNGEIFLRSYEKQPPR